MIGAIAIYRQEVRPFTDKQIELVTNFAAQAVIAIENTRLLSELRESLGAADRDLGSAASHFKFSRRFEPVFEAMLENATRICEAKFGTLWFRRKRSSVMAMLGMPPAYAEFRGSGGRFDRARTVMGRCRMTDRAVAIVDRADSARDRDSAIAATDSAARAYRRRADVQG